MMSHTIESSSLSVWLPSIGGGGDGVTWGHPLLPRVPPFFQLRNQVVPRDRRVKLISRRDGDGAFLICASSDQVLALQIYIQKARPT